MERRQDPRVWGLSRLCRWCQALLRLLSCFRRGLGGPAWCHHLATAITSTSYRTSTSFVVKFSQVPVGWHVSELGHRSVEPSPPEGALPRILNGRMATFLRRLGGSACRSPHLAAGEAPSAPAPQLTWAAECQYGWGNSVSYRKHFHWVFVSYVELFKELVAEWLKWRPPAVVRELSVELMVARKPSMAFNLF